MAFVIQGSLFLVVDILRKWGGRPFFYPGILNKLSNYSDYQLFHFNNRGAVLLALAKIPAILLQRCAAEPTPILCKLFKVS
nr:unnamed protein product [Callosobruchus analis]